MHNKNLILNAILGVLTVFSIIVTFSSFHHLKKMELEFNEKKASLVKENLDLKDRIDSMQELVNQKTEAATALENEKKTLMAQIKALKAENEKIITSRSREVDELKKKSATLKRRIAELENSPLLQRIREAIEQEENTNIRKVLEDAINKVELIKSGKNVNLEPIVITKKETQTPESESTSAQQEIGQVEKKEKTGIILSIDRKNNLAVINLGRKDDIKEGDRCIIMKDNQEIAQAEIISTRYRIAAAFINDILYKYTINDIKENLKVKIQ